MVMVAIPFKKELFASKAVPMTLRDLVAGNRPKIPKRTFYDAIQVLKRADILGNDYSPLVPIVENGVVLNTRDLYLTKIFSSRLMGPLLDRLASGQSFGTRELASILESEPSTVKRVVDKLRQAGVVDSDGHVLGDLIYRPTDLADEVPRLHHRKAVKHFLSLFDQKEKVQAFIIYGDAAVGKATSSVEILAIRRLSKLVTVLEELNTIDCELAGSMAGAAQQVSIAYPPTRFMFAVVGSFDWQSYHMISKPMLSPRLYRASQGITVFGDASANLARLFEDWRMMAPMSPDELARALKRGYVANTETGYEATMKWVNEYVAPATTKATEDEITVIVDSHEVTIPRIVLVKGKES
jgi:hypothetical protein